MSAWRDSLERLGVRVAPDVGGFWRWWQRSLLAWLPARWQWQLGLIDTRLLLSRDAEQLRVLRQRDALVDELARLPWPVRADEVEAVLPTALQALPQHWLLPANIALRCRLRLPLAAQTRLHDVARFEIDRQTPFAAEQVYYAVRVLERRADTLLDAELVVVPRRLLGAWAQEMARVDSAEVLDASAEPLPTVLVEQVPEAWLPALAGIDVADAQGRPLGVNLLPGERRRHRVDPMRRVNLLLLAAGLLLLVGAGWLLLASRERAAEQFSQQLQHNSASARKIAAQRQQLQEMVGGAAFFERQRAQRPTAVEVWDELSRRLPAGTYLEKFSIEGRQLQLIGLSTEASSLVRRLEGSSLWHTPSLTGVLQSDSGRGLDRFTITADLTGDRQKEATNGTAQR
jgi:general secretion pathway protein L